MKNNTLPGGGVDEGRTPKGAKDHPKIVSFDTIARGKTP